MRLLGSFWLFYRKILVPTLILSIMFGVLEGAFSTGLTLKFVGIGYLFSAPLFQYFIYEIRYKNEYYFYHNLGLSKTILWLGNVILSLLIGLSLMFI